MPNLKKLKICSKCQVYDATYLRVSMSENGRIKKHYVELSKCAACYEAPDEDRLGADITNGFAWVKLEEKYQLHLSNQNRNDNK